MKRSSTMVVCNMVKGVLLMFTLILIVSVFAGSVNADSFDKIIICDKKKLGQIKKRLEINRNVKFFVLDDKFYSKSFYKRKLKSIEDEEREIVKLLYEIKETIKQLYIRLMPFKRLQYGVGLIQDIGFDEFIKNEKIFNVKSKEKDYLKYLRYWILEVSLYFDKNNEAYVLNTVAKEAARRYVYYLKNGFIDFVLVAGDDSKRNKPNKPRKFEVVIYIFRNAITKKVSDKDKETYIIHQFTRRYTTPWTGNFRCVNGACVVDTGVIKMQYPENNPRNFRIDAPWKNTINRQILQELKKRGYKYDIQYDLTAPFLAYLVERSFFPSLEPKETLLKGRSYVYDIIYMAFRINAALLDGNLTLLNQLIESFVKNKIK